MYLIDAVDKKVTSDKQTIIFQTANAEKNNTPHCIIE
jgi:hypothetical protein